LQTYYAIRELVDGLSAEAIEDLTTQVEEILGEIESLIDETQGSLDNMPEGLQQGDTGQLLQERIDVLENWQGELEDIDLDFEFEEEEPVAVEGQSEEELKSLLTGWAARKVEAEREFIEEKIGELQGTDSGL